MPRASWKGFLRLSLVSCPVYLSPATTRTKAVRLRQVWVPGASDRVGDQADKADEHEAWPQPRSGRGQNAPAVDDGPHSEPAQEMAPATPIALRPHDPHT